jgi:hypothetical protein
LGYVFPFKEQFFFFSFFGHERCGTGTVFPGNHKFPSRAKHMASAGLEAPGGAKTWLDNATLNLRK